MGALLKMKHLKQLKYCSKGIKTWCEINGFSYMKLVKEGYDTELVFKTGDSMAIKAAKIAEEEI